MKSLKFRKHLIPQILEGRKTTTWRLFDDKDLQIGDKLELLDFETKEKFAEAEITDTKEKRLGEITIEDYPDKGKYQELGDRILHYRSMYGKDVNTETIIKIISFKLNPR